MFALYLILGVRDTIRVIVAGPFRFAMARMMLTGLAAGLVFRPRTTENALSLAQSSSS